MTQAKKTSSASSESWLASRPPRAELSRYLDMLRSHWLLLVGFIAAGLVAAFAYVTVAHKTYSAEADLLVTPVGADDPNLIGLPLVRETADPTADVLTVAKLVDSPSVASLVAKRMGGNPNTLLNYVTATPVTQSEIIAVQATAPTPARATKLANAFAQETVQARTNAMHAQLARLIPTLKASMTGLAPGDRAGLSAQLAVLETLRASPDPTVRVSSPATPPRSPASPDRKLSLAAGGFAGLVIGLLMMLAINALDPKLRDEDQLRELYNLPLLARVPKQRSGRAPLTPRELTPPVAEAFRTLRSAFTVRVGERKRGAKRGHAILLTGDAAADGKTTVALNLAVSLTAAGKQVIMIESDLRRPSIGQALRVRAPRGVAEVLLGKAELVEALIWLRQYGPNLELLLATSEDAREIDRISPESARQLVRTARGMCDFVVIDSPPMTEVTDAVAFAAEADDVLLVARIGNSQVRKMSDLGELLTRQGIVPTGVVLVGATEPGGYYYYRGPSDQPVFAGLLQKRNRDERTLPVEHRVLEEGNGISQHGAAHSGNGAESAATASTNGASVTTNGVSAQSSAVEVEEKASPSSASTPTRGAGAPKEKASSSQEATATAASSQDAMAAPKPKSGRTREGATGPAKAAEDEPQLPGQQEASDPQAGEGRQ